MRPNDMAAPAVDVLGHAKLGFGGLGHATLAVLDGQAQHEVQRRPAGSFLTRSTALGWIAGPHGFSKNYHETRTSHRESASGTPARV